VSEEQQRIIFRTDGTIEAILPHEVGDFEALKARIGTDMGEIVQLHGTGHMFVIDENGKLNDRPVNKNATELFRKCYPWVSDYIVGDAALMPDEDIT
jgi:hypothetical protein